MSTTVDGQRIYEAISTMLDETPDGSPAWRAICAGAEFQARRVEDIFGGPDKIEIRLGFNPETERVLRELRAELWAEGCTVDPPTATEREHGVFVGEVDAWLLSTPNVG